jgi:hypothetical protein
MEMSILSMISTAVSVVGSLMQASSRSDAAEYNAEVARRNAAMATQQAESDAEEQRRRSIRQIGAMRAGYGASGVVGNEGSPLDVLAQSASDAEMDRLNILYRGRVRASGYEASARLDDMRAENEQTAGMFGAGRALVLGLGQSGTGTQGDTGSSGGYVGSGLRIPDSVGSYYGSYNW